MCPSTRLPLRARYFAPRAVTAPVRISVMPVASRMASGTPVSGWNRERTATSAAIIRVGSTAPGDSAPDRGPHMRRFIVLAALCVLLAAGGRPVRAADQAWADCEQEKDWDRSIAGCTTVLGRPRESAQN